MGAWAGLGCVGSFLIAVAGPRAVADAASPWWYQPSLGGKALSTALVYTGIAVLCAAWIGLGRHAAGEDTTPLILIAVLWLVPLALGPALFSRDAYSYLAQGTVLHIGANPYRTAPGALAGGAHAPLLAAVSPFWRHTTAPYGPLFLGIMSVIVGITGNHLVAGILLTRVVELAAVALLAVQVPRLARALGADPSRALWLAVLNPLVALELVAAAHNDVLMAALLVAGLTAALRGRPVWGIALCALAGTLKLPALAGAVFIAVAWAREERGTAAMLRFGAAAAAAAAVTLAAVSVVTGVGASWLSASVLATPARVHLAVTPSTQIGYTLASLAHDLGLGVSTRGAESAVGSVTLAACALLGVLLAVRVRVRTVVPFTGWLLLAAAALGPAAWPWYFCWALPLLAACRDVQRLSVLWIGSVAAVLVIKPNGILALPQSSAPAVLAVYAALAGLWWAARRGGPGRGLTARSHSALVGT
ncbi:MAG TPA: polyprenol phosphomannose-dependent alpha 1,6 mannosyltransferase MptB [Solirubrobacteraceae bacterium]|nr:polyprenol phosphomannose-dependent alpha 1,6 mannosyltransferase MptB [Solirubrobacteraceae bacterium]